jgi:hypothetical protein
MPTRREQEAFEISLLRDMQEAYQRDLENNGLGTRRSADALIANRNGVNEWPDYDGPDYDEDDDVWHCQDSDCDCLDPGCECHDECYPLEQRPTESVRGPELGCNGVARIVDGVLVLERVAANA